MNKLPGEPPFARFLQQIATEMRGRKNPYHESTGIMDERDEYDRLSFRFTTHVAASNVDGYREFQELMSQRKHSIMQFIKLAIEIPVNN